jgi:hypothetical protein
MVDPARAKSKAEIALRKVVDGRLSSLYNERLSWWGHWADLAAVFLPRRYRWFVTPNQYNRGSAHNQAIVDETGVLAARTLATGLQSNLTSPTKQWFRLKLAGSDAPVEGPVADWLAECTRRMLEVLGESNFYTILGQAYHDLSVFGSAAVLCYEDDVDVVRFYGPCLGEFYFGLSKALRVDTLYREYTYTIRQLVDEFGLENVSESVKTSHRTGGNDLEREVVVCHAVEPNTEVWSQGESYDRPVSTRFQFREVYWEKGSPEGCTLRVAGFREKPFGALRWDVSSNDAYGRSPGMDALPAVRQLQIEQRRKGEAIDKMVRPPMVGSLSMLNQPASILPGGITYVSDPQANGFKPAYTVEPRIQELKEDLQEVQSRVYAIFYNDLFRPALDESKVQTATYWAEVQAEKLLLLGPVVERLESEALDDLLNRVFAIMERRGLFPDPPEEIAGLPMDIQYISILATAQAAASTAAIERLLSLTGNLVAVSPGALDNVDVDAAIREYSDLIHVPPNIVRSLLEVQAIRENRAQQEQAAAALQATSVLASGAKVLSETDVGGGQNALQMVLQ